MDYPSGYSYGALSGKYYKVVRSPKAKRLAGLCVNDRPNQTRLAVYGTEDEAMQLTELVEGKLFSNLFFYKTGGLAKYQTVSKYCFQLIEEA